MKFTMNRTCVIVSTLGHAIGFEKGVPTHVPPGMYEEVLAKGAAPDEEIPFDESKVVEISVEDRKLLLQVAIEEIVTRNDTADFTAGGLPHAKVLSAKVGFNVLADERDAAYAAFQAGAK